MAWNPQKKPPKGLPNLEEEFKKFFKSLFTRSKKPSQTGNPQHAQIHHKPWKTWVIGFIVIASMWALSGIYQVQDKEQVIISTFAQVKEMKPGWHWYARFIQQKYDIDPNQILSTTLTESLISQDQATLSLDVTVQYQVNDAMEYLFGASDINAILQQIIEAKLTQAVANVTLGQLLGDNSSLEQNLQQQIQQVCNQYDLSIQVQAVTLENVQVPDPVQTVLSDLQNAAAVNQNSIVVAQNQAQFTLNNAKAEAAQMISDAKAKAALALPKAEQETAKFLAILPAYQQNPQVTRERLYYDTMQAIYSKATVLIVKGNNAVTLPANFMQTNDKSKTQAPATTDSVSDDLTQVKQKARAYFRWKEAQSSES